MAAPPAVTNAAANSSAIFRSGGPGDFRGLYVLINPAWVFQAPSLRSALAKPYIDGAVLTSEWSGIEPAPGVYDFTALDQWIVLAVRQHEKLSLAVMAGLWTPDWLYKPPYQVPNSSFRYNRSPQGTPNCTTLVLPSPWNPTFIREYNQMMRRVAQHLHTMKIEGMPANAAYDALRIVKLDGINNTTEELRLYANQYPHADPGPCHQTSAPPVWAAAGFRPSKIKSAWTEMADNIAVLFPDKILSTDVIQNVAFPAVDENGQVYQPRPGLIDPLSNEVIAIGIARFPGRYSVQWDALSTQPPDPAVLEARRHGAIEAWQLNDILGTQGTGYIISAHTHRKCSLPEFQATFDNGIRLGGKFIEVFAQNVDAYAPAFITAHEELRKGDGILLTGTKPRPEIGVLR